MMINKVEVEGYLRERGKPLRTVMVPGQLTPKQKYSLLEGVDLYSLEPHKLYAYTVPDLLQYNTYSSQREL